MSLAKNFNAISKQKKEEERKKEAARDVIKEYFEEIIERCSSAANAGVNSLTYSFPGYYDCQ